MLNEQTPDAFSRSRRVVLGVISSTRSGGGPAHVTLLRSKHQMRIQNDTQPGTASNSNSLHFVALPFLVC